MVRIIGVWSDGKGELKSNLDMRLIYLVLIIAVEDIDTNLIREKRLCIVKSRLKM